MLTHYITYSLLSHQRVDNDVSLKQG